MFFGDGGVTFLPDLTSHPRNDGETLQYCKLCIRIMPQRLEFDSRTIRTDFMGDKLAPNNVFSPKSHLAIILPYLYEACHFQSTDCYQSHLG